jgi:hypothetical protein
MGANTFKEVKENIQPGQVQESEFPRKMAKIFDLFGGITKEQVMSWMPFIFFLTFLALIYISNSYYAEKNIRKMDKISSELKEFRSLYLTSKSNLMVKSKQSEVATQLELSGVKESIVPPKKIVITEAE